MLVALHVHTNYSACSESRLEQINRYCRDHGIEAIAITDHNVIEGALALKSQEPHLKVIIGEEVSTRDGEIVGLFLQHKIEPGLPLRETCLEIKSQGGLVYLPHPLDKFKVHRVRQQHALKVLDLIDIVEIYNAKISLPLYNARAKRFAEKHGKVGAVGSDSHFVASIGSAIISMEPFEGAQDFLEKLSRATFKIGASSLLSTWWVRMRKLAGAR